MESELESDCSESVNLSDVTAVAAEWMLDFMFVSLCRRFKEGKFEEFDETLSTFEAICRTPSLNGHLNNEKTLICAFLSRVLHGKDLDVEYEEDDRVTPLMSAAKIWLKLEQSVADKTLFQTITNLLVVQSVAVCLKEGQRSASYALKWFENEEFPQILKVKLKKIVTQNETHHPFFTSFSFSRLMETVKSYLDAYLEKNPSDYILKRATEKLQSSQNAEDVMPQDSAVSEESNKSTEDRKKKEKAPCRRTKRILLSTKMTDLWKPESNKKAILSLRRISEKEISQTTVRESARCWQTPKKRKRPQKWTWEEDYHLKAGVSKHGPGKWAQILMDYDFEGRTGVMLKDRWRVLKQQFIEG
ncbi:telomeric repeat-binding factor 1 [Centropristis striata]|uniref:telomeric repeat-binding factor 1 n=1 Tax=Centropristis striata TaxID=184440 RepID=UPI0027DFC956|nr:telomeric repeat-binding factor 1 [Centropristis striata]